MTTQSHEYLARRMYSQWAGNQDIHCNRMPTWDELSENERREWLLRAQAAIIGYDAIRYVSVGPEDYVKQYAIEYARRATELERERYEEMRLTLIGQVHELMCAAECGAGWLKSLGLRDDARSIEGAIAHARKVSEPYNYNGRGTT